MNELGLNFHHLGLAVRTKDAAINFLSALGYSIGEQIYDNEQKVNLILCHSDLQPDVEIIFPAEQESPIDSILQSNESLIYHLCYTTDNIEKAIRQCKLNGFRVIPVSEPKPAILFNNQYVAFYYIKGFGLIELLQVSQ